MISHGVRVVRLVAAGTGGSGSVNILRQLLLFSLTQETASDAASERRVYAAAAASASASAKRTTTVLIDAAAAADAAADAETCGNQTNRTIVAKINIVNIHSGCLKLCID